MTIAIENLVATLPLHTRLQILEEGERDPYFWSGLRNHIGHLGQPATEITPELLETLSQPLVHTSPIPQRRRRTTPEQRAQLRAAQVEAFRRATEERASILAAQEEAVGRAAPAPATGTPWSTIAAAAAAVYVGSQVL